MSQFEKNLETLESAEDFLNYFAIPFDANVVQVNRLHILQRFHNYLVQAENAMPENEAAKGEVYKRLLQKAYQDFVDSDALTEKVFKVFNRKSVQEAFIPIDKIAK